MTVTRRENLPLLPALDHLVGHGLPARGRVDDVHEHVAVPGLEEPASGGRPSRMLACSRARPARSASSGLTTDVVVGRAAPAPTQPCCRREGTDPASREAAAGFFIVATIPRTRTQPVDTRSSALRTGPALRDSDRCPRTGPARHAGARATPWGRAHPWQSRYRRSVSGGVTRRCRERAGLSTGAAQSLPWPPRRRRQDRRRADPSRVRRGHPLLALTLGGDRAGFARLDRNVDPCPRRRPDDARGARVGRGPRRRGRLARRSRGRRPRNHDWHSNRQDEVTRILEAAGIAILDRGWTTVDVRE